MYLLYALHHDLPEHGAQDPGAAHARSARLPEKDVLRRVHPRCLSVSGTPMKVLDLTHTVSGRTMEIWTTEPCMQM